MVEVSQFSVFNYLPAEAPSLEEHLTAMSIKLYSVDHMQFRVRKDQDSTTSTASVVPVGGTQIYQIEILIPDKSNWVISPEKYVNSRGSFKPAHDSRGKSYGNTGWMGDFNYFIYPQMLDVGSKMKEDFQIFKIWFSEWAYNRNPNSIPIKQDSGTLDLRLLKPT